MGRQLERKDSDIEFQKYHPGCMWGILHILDYQNRSNGKKVLPRRKRGRGRVAICCKDPKTDSFDHYNDQVQEHLNADEVPSLDIVEATATNRTYAKAQMEAFIAKEMSGRLGLQALGLSRHVGSSRYELSGTKTYSGDPIIILQKTSGSDSTKLDVQSPQAILQQRLSSEKSDKARAYPQDAQSLNGETSCSHLKDRVDVLEIFQVNKKLFLEILHDPEVQAAQKLPIQKTFILKGRLKKSDSFPAAKSYHRRSLRPSTLEHKQKEIWSFTKVENATSVAQSQKFFAPKCTENTATISKSVEVKVADSGDASDTQGAYLYSPALSRGSSKHWGHPSLMSYFVGIKKKVKHAFKHNKKENGNTIADGIPIEAPSESKPSNSEKGKSLKGINSSNNVFGKVSLPHIRRAPSLSDSMDRYTRLFERSFSKEAPRHQYHSRSLRLTTEDRSLSRGRSLKTFRRRLSMPDLDSFLPFPDEASNDDLKSEMQNRDIANSDTNVAPVIHAELQQESVNASGEMPERPERERNIEVGGDSSENNDNSGNLQTSVEERTAVAIDLPEEQAETHQEEQLALTINSIQEDEDLCPVSVLETHFQDDIIRQPDFPVSKGKGFGLDTCGISAKEPKASAGLRESFFEDSATGCNQERAAKATSTANTHCLSSNFNRQDDPALDYVRDVLDISSFLDHECQVIWYSLDQPLSPNLFKELEIYLHPEKSYYQEDFSYDNDHQLLFDLVNEALLELFDSSLAYFPKQFSFAQSVRPSPKGNHVLNEVWKRISWHQSSSSRKDQSLNDIMRQDMAKGDGWMKLLLDVEDVALDLEDIIFDELLDEALDLLDN